ncbi:hypothetical protein DFR30_1982 [Thiogranum longum]|uniref:Uncharacterized protein n=1 Tax=Thiogranum longum TaxID=1537524 RepID=A0A4R1HH55_9GAMM|nr:hypothetical protein [Thiogranum longum]TCK18699.1 hypothetical protein DFR30_1982 [Thiogranum longum]
MLFRQALMAFPGKTLLALLVSAGLVFLSPLIAADDSPVQPVKKTIKPPASYSLNEFLGLWESGKNNDPIALVPQDPEVEAFIYRIEAHTNKRIWKGTYTPFQAGDIRREHEGDIELKYTPTADEINPEIPEWARKQVAGTLTWSLQLSKPPQCGQPSLLAKWYPGEVRWSDGDATTERRAWVAGEGKPRGGTIRKIKLEMPDALASSVLLLRLPLQTDALQRPLEGLVEGQLFHVDVYLPYKVARAQGENLSVSVRGQDGGLTGTLQLKSGAMRKGRPVHYTHYVPAMMGDNPTFASQSYLNEIGNHWQRLDLDLINGEVVKFSFGEAMERVRVYKTPLKRKLARYMESIPRLRGLFSEEMTSPVTLKPAKESAHTKLQMLKNMDSIVHNPTMPEYLRLEVAERYQPLLNHDYRLQLPREIYIHGTPYPAAGKIEDDYTRLGKNLRSGYYDNVVWTGHYEMNTITVNVSWLQKKKIRNALNAFHKDITYALYDWTLENAALGIPNTHISFGNFGELYSIFSGNDPYGKKLGQSERLRIASSVFFSSLLDWSQGKYIDHLSENTSAKHDLQQKRKFEHEVIDHQLKAIKQKKALEGRMPSSVSSEKLAIAEPVLASQPIDNNSLPPVRCGVPDTPDSSNLPQHDPSDLNAVKAMYGENANYDTGQTPEWTPQQFQTCNQGAIAIGHAEQTGNHLNEFSALKVLVEAGEISFDDVKPSYASHPMVNGWKEDYSIALIHAMEGETLQLPNGKLLSNEALATWRKNGWRIKQVVNVKNSDYLHAVDVQKFTRNAEGCIIDVEFGDSAYGRRISMPVRDFDDLKADYPLLLYRFKDKDGNPAGTGKTRLSKKSPLDSTADSHSEGRIPKTSNKRSDPESWIYTHKRDLKPIVEDFYKGKDEPVPPLHVTQLSGFKGIIKDRYLTLTNGANFSREGIGVSRVGRYAIRVRKGSEGYVELVPSGNATGLVAIYWKDGIGNGTRNTARIPAKHLEYFDPGTGPGTEAWKAIPQPPGN